MNGKFNNRTLLLVFVILAAILVVSRFISSGSSDRTLKSDLVQIDTSQVSSIFLYPEAEGGNQLEFKKSGAFWTVSKGDLTAPASQTAVDNLLSGCREIKAEQLVSVSPESWSQYQVDDTAGTRVIITEGKRVTLDLIVGRFHYRPPSQNSYPPYGQSRVSGETYVRHFGEDEVYAVNGFLAMSLNQEFSRWRDQTITRMNSSGITRILFDYQADSGFVAEKRDTQWLVSGLPADSAGMAQYLRKCAYQSHGEFADGFQPGPQADFRLVFEGDQMSPLQVRAFIQEDGSLILNSSINQETWFQFASKDEIKDLFPAYETLLAGAK